MQNEEKIDTSNIPKKGIWYEIYDFSDRDYGNDWGFILYFDGKEVERQSGFSKIRQAGDVARIAKSRYLNRRK